MKLSSESCYEEDVDLVLPQMMMFDPESRSFRQIMMSLNFKNEKLKVRVWQYPFDAIEIKFKISFPQLEIETNLIRWEEGEFYNDVSEDVKIFWAEDIDTNEIREQFYEKSRSEILIQLNC